jgi:hypothetical protein
MPWILRGAKAFKLFRLVIVRVLLLVIENECRETEQEHEPD